MADPRTALVLGFLIAGLAITAWVLAPGFRGPVEARRDLGTHRLALGSLVVVALGALVGTSLANAVLADVLASYTRTGSMTIETFLVAALSTQVPMLLVLYGRLIAPGAITWRDLGLRPMPLERVLRVGMATGLAALLLAAVIGQLLASFGVRPNQVEQFSFVRREGLGAFVLVLLVAAVVAPFVEELFFRGFLFGLYRRRQPLWVAYLASGALFAFLHALPGVMDLAQNLGLVLAVFVLGTLLAWTYQRTGSLYPGIVAHGVNNGVALVVLYSVGVT
jgi:membrane protease YdiL (CAAX protease family)